MNSFSSISRMKSNRHHNNNSITSFTNVGTIYCASQLQWKYASTPFNVDIYRNGSLIVSNYVDSSFCLYIDISLSKSTSYQYYLCKNGDATKTILASVSFTTPDKPAIPLANILPETSTDDPSGNLKITINNTQSYHMVTNYNGSVILVGPTASSTSISYSKDGGKNFTVVDLSTYIVSGSGYTYKLNSLVGNNGNDCAMCMNWSGNFMYILVLYNNTWSSIWICFYSFDTGATWASSLVSGLSTIPNGGNANDSFTNNYMHNCNLKCNHIGNRIIVGKDQACTIAISNDYGISYIVATGLDVSSNATKIFNSMTPYGTNNYCFIHAQPDFSKIIYHTGFSGSNGNYFAYATSSNFGHDISWNRYPNSVINNSYHEIYVLGYDTKNDFVYLGLTYIQFVRGSFSNPKNAWSEVRLTQTVSTLPYIIPFYDPSGTGFVTTTNNQISTAAFYESGTNGATSLHMSTLCACMYVGLTNGDTPNYFAYSDDTLSTMKWRISANNNYPRNRFPSIVSHDGATIYYMYQKSNLYKYM